MSCPVQGIPQLKKFTDDFHKLLPHCDAEEQRLQKCWQEVSKKGGSCHALAAQYADCYSARSNVSNTIMAQCHSSHKELKAEFARCLENNSVADCGKLFDKFLSCAAEVVKKEAK